MTKALPCIKAQQIAEKTISKDQHIQMFIPLYSLLQITDRERLFFDSRLITYHYQYLALHLRPAQV